MIDGAAAFFAVTQEMLWRIQETQMEAIRRGAELITECLAREGLVFTLGTGHSYLLAAEPFARAGGFWQVQLVACSNMGMVDGSRRSGRTEQLEGYAACVLPDYDMRAGDVLIAISNSGRNAVPIEAAIYARERNMQVIALTNVSHSQAEASRHSSGKRLMDVADVVLDNCGVHGDAAVEVPDLPYKVGPTSTVTGALLINALMVQAAVNLQQRGLEPPILISGNVDTPDREKLYEKIMDCSRPIKHR